MQSLAFWRRGAASDNFSTLPTHVPFNDERQEEIHRRPTMTAGVSFAGGCCCCCLCSIIVLLVVVYFVLLNYLTNLAVDEMLIIDEDKVMEFCESGLTPPNMTANIWWPGCGETGSMAALNDTCTLPCYRGDILWSMDAQRQEMGWKKVSYKSRVAEGIQTIELAGWWLPAKQSDAPRIVIQHGFQANSNKFRPQLMAGMLRALGYSVLLNNLRDHCYSQRSEAHIYEWGHAYPYDVLGALDFARNDPDGVLGGSVSDDKVGLLGISKGAFLTQITFGMEESLPAAWVDAPPFTADAVFRNGAKKKFKELGLPDFVFALTIDQVWSRVQAAAIAKGVNLTEHMPEEMLPLGPDTGRPLTMVQNKDDTTVPESNNEKYVALLRTLPAKYTVSNWLVEGMCHGDDHCVDHLRAYDEYLARLCTFWRGAFGQSADDCPAASP